MKRSIKLLTILLAGAGAFTSCRSDMEHFDNKIYHTADRINTVFVEEETDDYLRTLQAKLAMPAGSDIRFLYAADPAQVAWYNTAYGAQSELLPERYYELPEAEAVIPAGEVVSNRVEVRFKGLTQLDKTKVYVLPVSIVDAGIATLADRKTVYFVVKEASLVNVAANMKANAVCVPSWSDAGALNGLSQLTAEALVRVDAFAAGRGSNISTLMGVEGHFLIRFGDTAPDNQLQVVGRPSGSISDDKLTSPDWVVKPGRWTHIAVSYDSQTHEVNVYIDGERKSPQTFTKFTEAVNWGRYVATETDNERSFWIGYSYADDRYLDGDIAEVRVWNRVLSEEEIKAPNHFYKVPGPEENGALAAYWKFNEGNGADVADHSAHGNHAVARKVLTWNAVELPVK